MFDFYWESLTTTQHSKRTTKNNANRVKNDNRARISSYVHNNFYLELPDHTFKSAEQRNCFISSILSASAVFIESKTFKMIKHEENFIIHSEEECIMIPFVLKKLGTDIVIVAKTIWHNPDKKGKGLKIAADEKVFKIEYDIKGRPILLLQNRSSYRKVAKNCMAKENKKYAI